LYPNAVRNRRIRKASGDSFSGTAISSYESMALWIMVKEILRKMDEILDA
jgi:hypothetical protein